MRTKTLASLLILCGSTAALANLPAQQDAPLQNQMTNESTPTPDDTTAIDTMSNATDVEPSAEPAGNSMDAPPNATY